MNLYSYDRRGGVDVTIASTLVMASKASRRYASFVNNSDAMIWLSKGEAAVVDEGIPLNATGGSYEITEINLYTGPVYAIHRAAGNKRLATTEGGLT